MYLGSFPLPNIVLIELNYTTPPKMYTATQYKEKSK